MLLHCCWCSPAPQASVTPCVGDIGCTSCEREPKAKKLCPWRRGCKNLLVAHAVVIGDAGRASDLGNPAGNDGGDGPSVPGEIPGAE